MREHNIHQGLLLWGVQYVLMGYHFRIEGIPNLQNVGVNKIATPLFRQQNYHDPTTKTPYPLPKN